METQQAIAALAAIAQESRLAIFRLLVQVGPAGMIASKISEQLGIAPSSLSFHMKELAHADLVSVKQDGRYMIYSANFTNMSALIGFLSENCCGGKSCDVDAACSNPAPSIGKDHAELLNHQA